MDERARAIEAACRAAMQILASLPDRQARLQRIDPVPRATVDVDVNIFVSPADQLVRALTALAHAGFVAGEEESKLDATPVVGTSDDSRGWALLWPAISY